MNVLVLSMIDTCVNLKQSYYVQYQKDVTLHHLLYKCFQHKMNGELLSLLQHTMKVWEDNSSSHNLIQDLFLQGCE
jgi:hypothetical protein